MKCKTIIEPEDDIGTLELSKIIDTKVLQPIMEDFCKITGMLGAVLDVSGKVLVEVGWQDICAKFHRCHPDTLKNCMESDTILADGVPEGTYKAYRCKNNLWEMVTPLIVGGRHVGNVFIGQFFYDDEVPDVEMFRKQARLYGFDEKEYLAALDRVPRFSREKVELCMQFYSKLAKFVSTQSLSAIQKSRLLAEQKRLGVALRVKNEEYEAVNEELRSSVEELDVETGKLKVKIRELEQSEKFLQDSEERFQLMVENIKDYAIIMLGPEGRVTSWNKGAEQIKGYAAKEIIGQHFSKFYPPEDVAGGKPDWGLQEAVAHGRFEDDGWRVRKDGSRFIANVIITARFDQEGQLRGFSKITRNITESMQAKERLIVANQELEKSKDEVCKLNEGLAQLVQERTESLQESEGRFLAMANNISQLAWMADVQGSIFWYNQRWFDYTGTTLEDMRGWGWQKVHHPDHVQRVVDKIKHCFETGEVWEDTFPLRGTDGHYRWFLSRAAPVRDEHGTVLRWFGTNTDITERKEVEEDLLLAAERVRLAVVAGSVGIWDYDIANKILIWDDQMMHLYGVTRDTFGNVYASWRAGLHPEDQQRADEEIQLALRGEKEFDTEFRVVWSDGTIHTLRAYGTVWRDASGKPLRMIGTNWDITYQKQGEALLELQKIKVDNANSTLTILNDKLILKQQEAVELKDKADKANKSKSDFLANMSHELRTPLNAIIGFSDVLQEQMTGDLNGKQLEYVSYILSSGKHLLSLINDILDLSKVEAGMMELVPSIFPLLEVLTGTLSMVKEKAMKHGIKLDFELSPEADIEIEADERKLKQIMFNLLSNAVKFTPKGGSVRLSARLKKEEGRRTKDEASLFLASEASDRSLSIEISVADTGIGINPEDIPKLFSEFTQLESAYSKQYEGTGLGLALTKRLVELHGGGIWVESEPGKGCTFTFTLPVKQVPKPLPFEEEVGRMKKKPVAGRRALIVDDDPKTIDLIKETLMAEGYTVLSAPDGKTGLILAKHEKPDFVVLDLLMPRMSGFEVVEELRDSAHTASIPIIILTAMDLSSADKKRLQERVNIICEKGSLNKKQFAEMVKEVLGE